MFVKKRPEHKTLPRILVSNTMNCNCISISEGTSKLVKRLRQAFLLIKQSIPLVTLLLCHLANRLKKISNLSDKMFILADKKYPFVPSAN